MGIEKKLRNLAVAVSSAAILSSGCAGWIPVEVKSIDYYTTQQCRVWEDVPATKFYQVLIDNYSKVLGNSEYVLSPLTKRCEISRWIDNNRDSAKTIYDLAVIKYMQENPDAKKPITFEQFYLRNQNFLDKIEKKAEEARQSDIDAYNRQKAMHDAAGTAGGIF